jgi:copper chaperone CopZ
MKKITLKIIGMNCASCVFNIDGPLEETTGVTQSQTNYAKQQTVVTYDEAKITQKQLATIVKQAGYTVIHAE